MDRSIYTALNSMNILRDNQSVTAQNLANIGVTGFQKDIQVNFASVYLDRDKGMLFLFKEPKKAVFWMKNTYVSLDLIFIREGGFIDSIHENLEPLSTKKIKSKEEVIAVLEILGGEVEFNKIELDSRVLF